MTELCSIHLDQLSDGAISIEDAIQLLLQLRRQVVGYAVAIAFTLNPELDHRNHEHYLCVDGIRSAQCPLSSPELYVRHLDNWESALLGKVIHLGSMDFAGTSLQVYIQMDDPLPVDGPTPCVWLIPSFALSSPLSVTKADIDS